MNNTTAEKVNTEDVLFKDFVTKWLDEKKGGIKKISYDLYFSIVNDFLLPRFSGKSMEEICRVETVQQLEDELHNQEYSNATITNIITILKIIIRYYRGNIERIGYIKNKSSAVQFSNSDVESMITISKMLAKEDFKALGILIILYTGLSISELCALKWENINLEERTITVEKTIYRSKSTGSEDKKTEVFHLDADNPRKVYVNKKIAKILKKYKAFANPTDYVLSNSERVVEPRLMQMFLKNNYCKILAQNYSFSDLKEIFIISALKQGMRVEVLAQITGMTPGYIFERYSAVIMVSEDDIKKAMKKFSY